MSAWFYAKGSVRCGPHTEAEMRELAQSGEIRSQTLCWRTDFGSNWKPFSDTELSTMSSSDPHKPPPLPANHVSSIYAWLYALVPLIGAAVEQIIIQNSTIESIPFNRVIWFYVFIYAVLASLDSKMIARSGNPKVPNVWWFLFAPAYLWARARVLGERWKLQFWVMLLCLAASAVIQDPQMSEQFYLGTSLPTCNSSYAESQVIRLFNDLPLAKMLQVTGINLSNQREIKSVEKLRSCTGILNVSNDYTYNLTYSFEQRSKDIYVRMQVQ